MSEEFLAHYGVKGMRWGVRHERPRSGGRSERISRALKRGFKSGGAAIARGSSRVAKLASDRFKSYRDKKKELKEVAREAGYKSNLRGMREFNALRKRTLASHDPAVIAKGMHTLTDSEFKKKLDRVKLESQMRDVINENNRKAYEMNNRAIQLKKAKAEARASGILGKSATAIISATGTHAGKALVDKAMTKLDSVSTTSSDSPSHVFNAQNSRPDYQITQTRGVNKPTSNSSKSNTSSNKLSRDYTSSMKKLSGPYVNNASNNRASDGSKTPGYRPEARVKEKPDKKELKDLQLQKKESKDSKKKKK